MKRTFTKYPSKYIKSSYDRAEIVQQRVPHIIDWGESMYGGYFFNYIGDNKEVNGCHADSIKELEAQANSLGFTLKGAKRFDNTSGPLGWDLDDVEGSNVLSATEYPSNYVKANEYFPSDNIYQIDFYDMIGDLISLKTVCLFADSKEEARQLGQELAVALGYKPDKVMTQYAYITEGYLDRYYEPQEESGITYFIRKR